MSKIINMTGAAYMSGEHLLKYIGNYGDGSPALALYDNEGEEAAVVTVSLAGYNVTPPEGHVFIKNYSENEGVLKPLIEAGILSIQDSVKPGGSFVAFPLCKLEVELEELK